MRSFCLKVLIVAIVLPGPSALESQGQGEPERFFRRLDADGNGVLDKKEFQNGWGRQGRNSDKIRTRGKSRSNGREEATRSSRLTRFEVFPTQKPRLGEVAPEVELRDLQGKRVVLSELLKTKPVVIETGSYTCPVFRNRHASIEKLVKEFGDQVHLLVLYGKEAHPGSGRFEEIQQPKQNDERIELAQKAAQELAIDVPVLTDDVNNLVTTAYGGLPNCGLIIGQDGRVFHKLAWIHPTLLREPLTALLKMGGSGGPKPAVFPVGGNHPSESGQPREAKQASMQQPPKGSKQPRDQRRLPVPDGVKVHRDIEYAQVDEHSLQLDLYLPSDLQKESKSKPPLLLWVHGGGWRNGDKGRINPMFIKLTGEGYATASINYRLNGLMGHPEHIHDCKAAVRWLRANAEKYGYDATRIGVGGGSAGGHLALMLGMTADVEAVEGDIGGNLEHSSRVQAVLDLFGPSDFESFSKGNSQFRSRHRPSKDQLLSASPLHYLTDDDAPVLIFHGDEDTTVPASQSKLLHDRYQAAGLESTLHIIPGASHGGPQFSDATRYALVKAFLERHLAE